ncbi:transporter substrate-binding domain-containing protein [Desulfopila sp. IMCC35008]|uniref:transporter substrate-binding domain-containing protein n=1 Tax=Desulfopila sp. IMCC35008 TaxID=2653858 RepID=UPI0013D2C293|nr:transporter substrate-binding domain-containing protein [Desulfopila sp. IMCC35008]
MRLFGFLIFLFLHVTILKGIIHAESILLTQAEQEWILNHKTIRISGPQAFPPFQYVNDNNEFVGMASDYINYIADQVGLEIVVVKNLAWSDVLKKVQSKEIDLLSCTTPSPERTSYLNFSTPHLSFPLVIITRKDAPFINDIYSLQNKTVTTIKNNITETWLKRENIDFTPLFVQTPLKALEAVALGKADAHIENLAAASYLIEKEGWANLKIASPTSFENYALSIGVRKDWPELISIINKGLAAIPQEKHNEIRQKWIYVRYEHGIQLMDFAKWLLVVAALASIVFSAFFIWNRRLAVEILERKNAEKEKEKLISELQTALDEIRILRGILPICSECKNIRDDKGYWTRIETYIGQHSEVDFSHSICPECIDKLYGKEDWFDKKCSHNQLPKSKFQ